MSYLDYRYSAADVPKFDAAQAPSGGLSNPAMAGMMMGGQFLSQYMAQKAADERSKREREAQIAQNQADGEINSMKFLDNVYKGALR